MIPGESDPRSQLSRSLRPGERLLWVGRPDPALVFTGADLFMIPFSFMWAGFAVFWEVSVIREGNEPFLMLWGLPFLVIGAYVLVGRFFYKRWRKRRTLYGLTGERVLVAVGPRSLQDIPIRDLPVSIKKRRGGTHVSVAFGARTEWPRGGFPGNTGFELLDRFEPAWAPIAFYDVADPEVLLAALDRARAPSS